MNTFKRLPKDRFDAVMNQSIEYRRRVFIAGFVDFKNQSLTLVRGDSLYVSVPMSLFVESGTTKPNFSELGFGDYGHTVRLGKYEATADSILEFLFPSGDVVSREDMEKEIAMLRKRVADLESYLATTVELNTR